MHACNIWLNDLVVVLWMVQQNKMQLWGMIQAVYHRLIYIYIHTHIDCKFFFYLPSIVGCEVWILRWLPGFVVRVLFREGTMCPVLTNWSLSYSCQGSQKQLFHILSEIKGHSSKWVAGAQLGSSSKVIRTVPKLMLSVKDLGNSWKSRLDSKKHHCEFKRALKMSQATC